MVPHIAFMRIMSYGSTCVVVKNGIRIVTNTFKNICCHRSGLFDRDGQSRRRDCEVGVTTAYELDGAGFETC